VAGDPIPENTMVISTNLGWSNQGLTFWRWIEVREGRDSRQSRDTAADTESLAHLMIEQDTKDRALRDLSKYPLQVASKAWSAFLNYLQWKRQMQEAFEHLRALHDLKKNCRSCFEGYDNG